MGIISSTEQSQTFTNTNYKGYAMIGFMLDNGSFVTNNHIIFAEWNTATGILTIIKDAATSYEGFPLYAIFVKIY